MSPGQMIPGQVIIRIHDPKPSMLHRKVKRDGGLNIDMARYEGSKTPLGGNAEYITVMYAGREDWVVGMVFADQAGTLHIEQSTDGTNWDIDTSYTVTASDGKGFKEEIFAPYVRIRYTNGATPNTVFRITSRFSSAGNR